jgi:hypothetical protein
MIGMTLRVEMADGETFEAPITYGVACRWEDPHPTLSVGRFLEDMKFKPLAWLAWDALRTKKIVVPLFSTWVENVMDITFLPKAKAGQQDEQPT